MEGRRCVRPSRLPSPLSSWFSYNQQEGGEGREGGEGGRRPSEEIYYCGLEFSDPTDFLSPATEESHLSLSPAEDGDLCHSLVGFHLEPGKTILIKLAGPAIFLVSFVG